MVEQFSRNRASASRRRNGELIRSRRVMKNLMKKRFVLRYYRLEFYFHLQDLCQGAMCMEYYMREFETLTTMRFELIKPEDQRIARCIRGLNTKIVDMVELVPYTFLGDVTKLAVKLEKQKKHSNSLNISKPIMYKNHSS